MTSFPKIIHPQIWSKHTHKTLNKKSMSLNNKYLKIMSWEWKWILSIHKKIHKLHSFCFVSITRTSIMIKCSQMEWTRSSLLKVRSFLLSQRLWAGFWSLNRIRFIRMTLSKNRRTKSTMIFLNLSTKHLRNLLTHK